MAKLKWSAISLLALGLLLVCCVVGRSLFEWEWWDFLLILSSLAFVVGLISFLMESILRAASS